MNNTYEMLWQDIEINLFMTQVNREIRDDRNYMSMLEDFWLPSREGGRGTDITTLLVVKIWEKLQDIEYFQKKLYRSLNVPVSRLESQSRF